MRFDQQLRGRVSEVRLYNGETGKLLHTIKPGVKDEHAILSDVETRRLARITLHDAPLRLRILYRLLKWLERHPFGFASLYVDLGLQDMADSHYGIAADDDVDTMCVSNFGTLVAGTTTVAAATFKDANLFTATPTRAGKVVTCVGDWAAVEINGSTITTITLHNDGAGAFTGVQCGVDGQSLVFQGIPITIRMDVTFSSG